LAVPAVGFVADVDDEQAAEVDADTSRVRKQNRVLSQSHTLSTLPTL